MSEKILKPVSQNPPAKVKDSGVIALAMAGGCAYNAKGGDLLLLPLAELKKRELSASIRDSLLDNMGVQPVDCGNDESVFSLAERFVREYGDFARAFSDERARSLKIIGWCPDRE